MSPGSLAGITILIIVFATIIGVMLIYFYKSRKGNKKYKGNTMKGLRLPTSDDLK